MLKVGVVFACALIRPDYSKKESPNWESAGISKSLGAGIQRE